MAYLTDKHFQFDWDALHKARTDYSSLFETAASLDKYCAENAKPQWPVVGLCFSCRKELQPPCIVWAGEPEIGFHVECADYFSAALKRDVLEAELGRQKAQSLYADIKSELDRKYGVKRQKESPTK